MNNYKDILGAEPIRILRIAMVALVTVSLLAMPVMTLANSHNDDDQNDSNGHGRAYGRNIVIPPIIIFLSHWEEEYGWLPPGLARLLERFEDHFGPIDDDDDNDDDDNTDPELEDVAEEVGISTTTLRFEFSEAVQVRLFASSEAGFGNNDAGVIKQSRTNYQSEHEFDLEDLEEATQYFYRVEYRDNDGNTVISDEMNFTTGDDENGDDTTDPLVESLTDTVGTSTLEVEVTFNELSRVSLLISSVDGFNNDTDDLLTFNHTDYETEHTFSVGELTPDNEYFYRLRFEDEAGNTVLSQQFSFITDEVDEDTTGPVLSNIAGEAGSTTIVASFTTDEVATGELHTATTSGFAIGDAGVIVTDDTTLQTEHELTIIGLTSSTTYYHIIVVEDESGNSTESDEFTFGTQ